MPLRVLVIDDSLTIRAMIEQIVQDDSPANMIALAADVTTARQMIQSFFPTVITLDLSMPGGGGLDFLDYLRGRAHAPVVVVSSSTTEGAAATTAALAHGAVACFDKAALISGRDRFMQVLIRAAKRRPEPIRRPVG